MMLGDGVKNTGTTNTDEGIFYINGCYDKIFVMTVAAKRSVDCMENTLCSLRRTNSKLTIGYVEGHGWHELECYFTDEASKDQPNGNGADSDIFSGERSQAGTSKEGSHAYTSPEVRIDIYWIT